MRGGTGRLSSVTLYVTTIDMSLVEVGFSIACPKYDLIPEQKTSNISCYQDDRTTDSRVPLANQWPLKNAAEVDQIIMSIIHEICVNPPFCAKLFTMLCVTINIQHE